MTALFGLLAASLLLAGTLLLVLWMWRRAPHVRRRIVVNLVKPEDLAFSGVLWSQRGAWLTLRDVRALRNRADPVPMDGELVVERRNIAFTQVLS